MEPGVWKWGYTKNPHEKPILPKAFHERRTCKFGGESGALSSPWKYEFGIGGDAISWCLGGLTPVYSESIFYHVLNSSATPAHPISMQLWVNTSRPPVAPPVVRFKGETACGGPVSDIPRASIWLSTGLLNYVYVTKVFSTRKPAFRILLICPNKLDTTNRISIAIVDEVIWWCKWVQAKANK